MRIWTLRLGLSLMVLVGFWTNRLPAQQIFLAPTVAYEPAHHPSIPPAYAEKAQYPPAQHMVHRVLNNHGMGCGMDPYYSACSNWHYEARFILGSCRLFFSQSCPPGESCRDKYRQR